MPYRRRRQQNGDHAEVCPRQINCFLEHCQEGRGYELAEGLKPFVYERNPVDTNTVYRLLHDLEKRGLVTSRWDTSNTGPTRRVYHTTEEGERYPG